jgi:hypothetical protein
LRKNRLCLVRRQKRCQDIAISRITLGNTIPAYFAEARLNGFSLVSSQTTKTNNQLDFSRHFIACSNRFSRRFSFAATQTCLRRGFSMISKNFINRASIAFSRGGGKE